MVIKVITTVVLSLMLMTPSSLHAADAGTKLKRTVTTELGAKIFLQSKKFEDIGLKMLLLSRRDQPVANADLFEGIDRLNELVSRVAISLRSISIMMTMVPHIEEQYRIVLGQAVAEELDRASEAIRISMPEMEYYFEDSKYGILLLTTDDLRGILKETQKLLVDGKQSLTTVSHGREAQ